jgi:hypothetical protein
MFGAKMAKEFETGKDFDYFFHLIVSTKMSVIIRPWSHINNRS